MTDQCSGASDEPSRLEQIVAKVFSTDRQPTVVVSDTAKTSLAEGADSQDDCAVFHMHGSQDLVVGSDYIRGPKFRLFEMGLLSERDLGYYLVAANVSDIAAMGAAPIGVLTVVRYPAEMSDESFSSVLYGIREACDYFNVPNVGGDIGGAERLILSGTALGVCKPGNALMRRGARPGDVLCITGPTGLAGAAMKYFRARKNQPEIESKYRKSLLAAWKRPEARVKQGICLGNSKLVTSCIDTSDGLKAAVESIAIASRVSFTIYEDHVPITPEVIAVCEHLGEEPMSVVMGDSVDFQLAFTVPEIHLEQLTHEFANKNLRFIPIGIAVEGTRGQLLQLGGDMIDLPGSTWRHDPD